MHSTFGFQLSNKVAFLTFLHILFRVQVSRIKLHISTFKTSFSQLFSLIHNVKYWLFIKNWCPQKNFRFPSNFWSDFAQLKPATVADKKQTLRVYHEFLNLFSQLRPRKILENWLFWLIPVKFWHQFDLSFWVYSTVVNPKTLKKFEIESKRRNRWKLSIFDARIAITQKAWFRMFFLDFLWLVQSKKIFFVLRSSEHYQHI